MSKFRKPTFKIVLYHYKIMSNGTHPIMVRVTFNTGTRAKQKYYSIGLTANRGNWNEELSRLQGNGKRLTDEDKDNNIRLNKWAGKLDQARKYFEDVDFTFDRFEQRFISDQNINVSVFKFMQSVIDGLYVEDRPGTAFSYRDTLKRVKEFRKQKDLTFRDIDLNFIEGFKSHLRKKNSINTTGIYLRTFKAVYNRAVAKGLIKSELSPFKGWRIETEATRKRALTKEQVDALKKYKAVPGSSHWHSLNLFMFSYYCRGINFGDIVRLTWSDIHDNRIYYQRKKTKDPFDIAIDSRIAEIIANYSANEHFIFPILKPGMTELSIKHKSKSRSKTVNSDLQDIAGEIGLPDDITFYWARHTFATTLKRSGVATTMISEVMGHSSERVTQSYLDSFETNRLDEIGQYL